MSATNWRNLVQKNVMCYQFEEPERTTDHWQATGKLVPLRTVCRPLLLLILINHITKNTSTANLEYAATIRDPYTKFNLTKLEKYQRRAVIFVNGDYSRESSVTSMLNEPKWPALQQRRTNINDNGVQDSPDVITL